ncbi:hypothetical protein M409DRAFT_61024 [Zasmidium cellare ATCC 36951]|uniref:Uncharacterized protein n=1 Tax=Zasmidium cellare ATCC 36951 TaxID=1080233 RepID=A0A6A6BX94_ZASCE|nr:uncharacterized protein M409DRAFT_61024 [Zasmidium cellare ATCC 36951]KAF2159203.1 hypothetical protein M409DRAFT_61024 [Zasmidium cellare ATCC 36951]
MPSKRWSTTGIPRSIRKNYWKGGAPIVSYSPNSQSTGQTRAESQYVVDRLTERRENFIGKQADVDEDAKDDNSLSDEEVESSLPALQMTKGESSKKKEPQSSSSGTSTKDKPIVIFKRPSAKALPIRTKPSLITPQPSKQPAANATQGSSRSSESLEAVQS